MLNCLCMKPCRSQQRIQALTLIEVVVILSVLSMLVAACIPALSTNKRKAQRIYCVNNLAQAGMAHRVWAGDNFEQYPLWATLTNNGSIDLLRAGIPDSQLALWNFVVMSNVLGTPDLLPCPADTRTTRATSFTNGFGNGNISYFVSMNATEDHPEMILSGDDNLAINGIPVKSGVLEVSSNTPIAWTDERHFKCGNIGMADGSVQQRTLYGLQMVIQDASTLNTNSPNRFAIP